MRAWCYHHLYSSIVCEEKILVEIMVEIMDAVMDTCFGLKAPWLSFTMLGLALVRVLIHGPLLKGNSMPCVPVDTQLQQCPYLGEGLGGPMDF